MTINDGGAAFPEATTAHGPYGGMRLRDWFAGQIAAAGIVTAEGLGNLDPTDRREIFDGLASISYELADAMLAARESKL